MFLFFPLIEENMVFFFFFFVCLAGLERLSFISDGQHLYIAFQTVGTNAVRIGIC